MTGSNTRDDGGLLLEFNIKANDFTAAGEASSKIKRTLQQIGFHSSIIRQVAIAAYEAEINIVIHSQGGEIKAHIYPDFIELLFEDIGPGIPDIDLAMQPGYSTASEQARVMGFGAGMGLPNIKKCVDEFAIQSEVGKGTVLRLVKYNRKG